MTNTTNPEPRKGESQRVVWIDFLRLFASLAIMWFHYPLEGTVRIWSGGLYVELFFILSGYFAISFMKKHGDSPGAIATYLKRMYTRLLPYVVVGTLLCYIAVLVRYQPNWERALKAFLQIPFEILLVQCTGVFRSHTIYWYLSILMFCLPIVMYGYSKYRSIWPYLVIAVPTLLYGSLIALNGTLRVNDFGFNIWARGIGGLMLGALAFHISESIRALPITKNGTMGLSSIEIICLAVFIGLTMVQSLDKTPMDTVIVFFLFCSLSISLSGKSITSSLKDSVLGSWLANLSLAIYCLHWPIFLILKFAGFAPTNQRHVVGSVITLISSALFVHIIQSHQRTRPRVERA